MAPNVSRNVLSRLRHEVEHGALAGKAIAEHVPKEHGSRDTEANVQGMKDITAIIAVIQQALDASIKEGKNGKRAH